MMQIQIIESNKINTASWNECVSAHANGLVYAYTEYLHALCDDWVGFVLNDYEAIMPVPIRKKMGILYTYAVPFIQQLGIIGQAHYQPLFIDALNSFIQYGDYDFNFQNDIVPHKFHKPIRHCNLILSLRNDYISIKKKYKTDLIQNLKKANGSSLIYQHADIETAINHFQKQYANRSENYTDKAFVQFKSFCFSPGGNVEVICRKVTDDSNTLLAIALFLKDNKRVYNMMNTTTIAGRAVAANHFLLDAVIQEFASTPLHFDFEGSNIKGIQHFYKNFGAEVENYTHIHINRLPLPLRLLKH